jgi:glucose-1-phosphate cytidylyltransferase
MKVVLFCGGIGSPHYTGYGQKKFIRRLGYKADVVKNYFYRDEACVSNDSVPTAGGKNLELL